MSQRLLAVVLLSTMFVACGGPTPPPVSGPPEAAEPPAARPANAEACPVFCTRIDGACTRPDVDDVSDAPCGAMARLERAPREACPDHCCRPAVASAGPDSDADGLVDADDRCPNEPEDAEGFEDQDGCPDADNDGDSIVDHDDMCCFAAEDADGVQDEDGCTEP